MKKIMMERAKRERSPEREPRTIEITAKQGKTYAAEFEYPHPEGWSFKEVNAPGMPLPQSECVAVSITFVP